MDILKSRTFWTILLDVIISLLLHYLGGEDTQFLIVTLQPIALFAIAKFTVDDREKQLTMRARIEADAGVEEAVEYHMAKVESARAGKPE